MLQIILSKIILRKVGNYCSIFSTDVNVLYDFMSELATKVHASGVGSETPSPRFILFVPRTKAYVLHLLSNYYNQYFADLCSLSCAVFSSTVRLVSYSL